MKIVRILFLSFVALFALQAISSSNWSWRWPNLQSWRSWSPWQQRLAVGTAGLGTAGTLAYLAYMSKDPKVKAAALASIAAPALASYWWWPQAQLVQPKPVAADVLPKKPPSQDALGSKQPQAQEIPASTKNEVKETPGISWGLYEHQGVRPSMEDRYDVQLNFRDHPTNAFFGLYDGNGVSGDLSLYDDYGLTPANKLKMAEELSKVAAKGYSNSIPSLSSLIKENKDYKQAFINFDAQWKKNFHNINSVFGMINNPTATTAAIVDVDFGSEPKVTMAWVGDSRILVLKKDGSFYITPAHSSERTWAKSGERLTPGEWKNKSEFNRLRSLDYSERPDLKAKLNMEPKPRTISEGPAKDTATRMFGEDGEIIIAEPEVKELDNLSDYYAIVLACDGVFESLKPNLVVPLINDALDGGAGNYSALDKIQPNEKIKEDGNCERCILAARLVVDQALQLGSRDNLSVLVIDLESVSKSQADASHSLASSSSSGSASDARPSAQKRDDKGKGREESFPMFESTYVPTARVAYAPNTYMNWYRLNSIIPDDIINQSGFDCVYNSIHNAIQMYQFAKGEIDQKKFEDDISQFKKLEAWKRFTKSLHDVNQGGASSAVVNKIMETKYTIPNRNYTIVEYDPFNPNESVKPTSLAVGALVRLLKSEKPIDALMVIYNYGGHWMAFVFQKLNGALSVYTADSDTVIGRPKNNTDGIEKLKKLPEYAALFNSYKEWEAFSRASSTIDSIRTLSDAERPFEDMIRHFVELWSTIYSNQGLLSNQLFQSKLGQLQDIVLWGNLLEYSGKNNPLVEFIVNTMNLIVPGNNTAINKPLPPINWNVNYKTEGEKYALLTVLDLYRKQDALWNVFGQDREDKVERVKSAIKGIRKDLGNNNLFEELETTLEDKGKEKE